MIDDRLVFSESRSFRTIKTGRDDNFSISGRFPTHSVLESGLSLNFGSQTPEVMKYRSAHFRLDFHPT